MNRDKFEEPLDEKELRGVYESIRMRAEQNPKSSSRVSTQKSLVDFVLRRNPVLFRTPHQEAYIQLAEEDGGATHPLHGSRFSYWLRHTYWSETGKSIPRDALSQVIELLASIAICDGNTIKLENRVAEVEGSIYYDLRDDHEQVVRINGDGWCVVKCPHPIFKTYAHQSAQTYPAINGDIDLLFKHLNVSDDEQQLLLKVYLVSAMIPSIPHPIPIIHGPHGSSKSTFMRVLRRVIDPSNLELLTFPRNSTELIQILDHHWCAFFDNVSNISPEESDELCKACTGGGMSKRRLYTDDEDVIYYFKRCIAINGINNVAFRPDLLSRSLMFKLEHIDSKDRVEEKIFWERFNKDLPQILGGVFDTLSKAIEMYDKVTLQPSTRLADFERWGYAIALAMGLKEEDFANAYKASHVRQTEEAIESNDLAYVIVKHLDKYTGRIEGEAQTLLISLNNLAEELGVPTNTSYWPKTPAAFGRRFRMIENNLLDAGYKIERKRGEKRLLIIESPGYQKSTRNDDVADSPTAPTVG